MLCGVWVLCDALGDGSLSASALLPAMSSDNYSATDGGYLVKLLQSVSIAVVVVVVVVV